MLADLDTIFGNKELMEEVEENLLPVEWTMFVQAHRAGIQRSNDTAGVNREKTILTKRKRNLLEGNFQQAVLFCVHNLCVDKIDLLN